MQIFLSGKEVFKNGNPALFYGGVVFLLAPQSPGDGLGFPELLAELDAKIRAMKDALPEAAEEFELDEDDEDEFDIRTLKNDDEMMDE